MNKLFYRGIKYWDTIPSKISEIVISVDPTFSEKTPHVNLPLWWGQLLVLAKIQNYIFNLTHLTNDVDNQSLWKRSKKSIFKQDKEELVKF